MSTGNEGPISVRVQVYGRVQGVAFRAWTAAQAEHLGLNGWVKNRRDGSVEAVLCGDSVVVQQMCHALHQGPRLARVDEVRVEEVLQPAEHAGFEILYDE